MVKFNNYQIITCNRDQEIKVWDITTGFCIKSFNNYCEVFILIKLYSDSIICGGCGIIYITNLISGRVVLKIETDPFIFLLKFNNKKAIWAGKSKINIYDLTPGKNLKSHNAKEHGILCLIKVNIKYIACGYNDMTIGILDSNNLECFKHLKGFIDSVICMVKLNTNQIAYGSWNLKSIGIKNLF